MGIRDHRPLCLHADPTPAPRLCNGEAERDAPPRRARAGCIYEDEACDAARVAQRNF